MARGCLVTRTEAFLPSSLPPKHEEQVQSLTGYSMLLICYHSNKFFFYFLFFVTEF